MTSKTEAQDPEQPAKVGASSYELVRVSRELVETLLAQEPQPVVLSGLERQEDGTIELWFRTPGMDGLMAIAQRILDEHYPADIPLVCDRDSPDPGPRLTAALRDCIEARQAA